MTVEKLAKIKRLNLAPKLSTDTMEWVKLLDTASWLLSHGVRLRYHAIQEIDAALANSGEK